MRRTVRFYRTPAGRCPVLEFLDGLSDKDAQKVLWVFRLIERVDSVPANYLKKLASTDDIWECRIPAQGGAFRVFAFLTRANTLVLTHGYSKKTQRLDPREIQRAERYKRDYLNRQRGQQS